VLHREDEELNQDIRTWHRERGTRGFKISSHKTDRS
jgi:hypothetical protein